MVFRSCGQPSAYAEPFLIAWLVAEAPGVAVAVNAGAVLVALQ
jgi:hypothetical protein